MSIPLRGARSKDLDHPRSAAETKLVVEKAIRKKTFSLYWCQTDDHDEDWFIVATSARKARSAHENAEGYDTGDAICERVARVPEALAKGLKDGSWPSHELIIGCGGAFLPSPRDAHEALRRRVDSGDRVVKFGDRIFAEGDIIRNVISERKLPGEGD